MDTFLLFFWKEKEHIYPLWSARTNDKLPLSLSGSSHPSPFHARPWQTQRFVVLHGL